MPRSFQEHLDDASRIVASWPAWKRNILATSSSPTMSHKREPIIRMPFPPLPVRRPTMRQHEFDSSLTCDYCGVAADNAKPLEECPGHRPGFSPPDPLDIGNPLTASDALRITQENLRGPVIVGYVGALERQIRLAAKNGRREIRPREVINSLRGMAPSWEAWQEICRHFESHGFQWTEHPNPDPGHPASHAYATLSW